MFKNGWPVHCAILGLACLAAPARPLKAEPPVQLHETLPAGTQYHVSVRVELSGSLQLPDKDRASRTLAVTGNSVQDYDERVLDVANGGPIQKTIRVYKEMDFRRRIGDVPQHSSLRPQVRRLVVLHKGTLKVPFSPDGPLTWGEIDLVRTDVFTPALAGLLPEGPVAVGARWKATEAAIRELTDVERIDEGSIECHLEQIVTLGTRRLARVALQGTVRGINEDGPNRQSLDGYFFFDLGTQSLSYLSLKGVHALLDKDGHEAGKIEGQFVLTRQRHRSRELDDDALRGIVLEPNENNTLLLYDNPTLGVQLLYPRRWHVGGVRGRQLTIDAAGGGSGLLLTLEPPARVPSGAQFQTETRSYLQQQQAKILAQSQLRQLSGAAGHLEQFALDVEIGGKRATMDYFVIRQADGGATLAARLAAPDRAALRPDVEKIARSVKLTRSITLEPEASRPTRTQPRR
ncbi:MAG TPA: hypothetical protein VFA18_13030 [Gemmataceae bacterium]|nr:hypothetical protein [Gemmataceae bacterium]